MKQISYIIAAVMLCFAHYADAQDLQGVLSRSFDHKGVNYEKGSTVSYFYYVSPEAEKDSCALYVLFERKPGFIPVIESLILEGVMPEGITISVSSGYIKSDYDDSLYRKLRPEEFDQNGPDFANLVVEEIIPKAIADAGVAVSTDPDKHFVMGRSSGGHLAWNALWYRNDFFHRGFLSSPTFSAMRGGEESMVLARKTEPRPIQVFITSGTVEPDYYFGDSFYAACNAADALKYAGYDVEFELYPKGGHCCNSEDYETWKRAMTWMFSKDKVIVPGRSERFLSVVPEGSAWEEAAVTAMPAHRSLKTEKAIYSVRKGKLKVAPAKGKSMVLDDLSDISAIGMSSDMWRLYVADKSRRFIYTYYLDSLGMPDFQYKLAPLHLAHDCRIIGGTDLCVTTDDRVFVATELGVQGIRSYGLTDIILPLPGDVPASKVWMEEDWLYAQSKDGVTFRRKVKATAHDGMTQVNPLDVNADSANYYDEGCRKQRPHFKTIFSKFETGKSIIKEN